MYIPEFWTGVLSVVSAEMIAFIAVVIYALVKSANKNKEERKNDSTRSNG